MIIHTGEVVPFGYGLVKICWDRLDAYEIAPIPICWIKRFWYWQLHKMKLFDWEKDLAERRIKNRDKIVRILDNLDSIYVRARIKLSGGGLPADGWGSYSLLTLLKLGEEKQAVDYIKKFLTQNDNE